jgi:hypothetical protein
MGNLIARMPGVDTPQEFINFLIKSGAEVGAINKDNETPLIVSEKASQMGLGNDSITKIISKAVSSRKPDESNNVLSLDVASSSFTNDIDDILLYYIKKRDLEIKKYILNQPKNIIPVPDEFNKVLLNSSSTHNKEIVLNHSGKSNLLKPKRTLILNKTSTNHNKGETMPQKKQRLKSPDKF